jgi:thiol-disulfide isomerase/thioredoxin
MKLIMRLNLIHYSIICVLTTFISYGQTKFYKTPSGQIIDNFEYSKLKADYYDFVFKLKVQQSDRKILFKENFKEIKRTKDSIIYSYKFEVKIHEKKVVGEIKFDSDDYIDKEFPLTSLQTLDNKTVTINALKGKPTLINFWFANCMPCIEEMPVLNKIKEKFKDRVNFIAITYETKEKVLDFLKKHNYTFIQIVDARKFTDELKMNSFPINVFLDKNGIAREIKNGIPYEMNDKEELIMGDGKNFIEILEELLLL